MGKEKIIELTVIPQKEDKNPVNIDQDMKNADWPKRTDDSWKAAEETRKQK